MVAALVDEGDEVDTAVEHRIDRASAASSRAVADGLSRDVDVVLIQHEFGIFGGRHGAMLGHLTRRLTVPYVLTLHTVVERYSAGQRAVLGPALADAALVLVFSQQAADLLAAQFHGVRARCRVVPHGAPDELLRHRQGDLRRRLDVAPSTRVLSTFGLVSPGKGIEHTIAAMPALRASIGDVVLVVAGLTHPAVAAVSGEEYRAKLTALARDLEVSDVIVFEDWFHDIDELAVLLEDSDVFVTSYNGAEQIVSGALSFAIAAGLPFVSTPYRYAVEMEKAGCGITVPFADPVALAVALGDVLTDDVLRRRLADGCRRVGGSLSWPQVGRQISALLGQVVHASSGQIQVGQLEA